MPFTIKFDPNPTQTQAAVIPDATPLNAGVFAWVTTPTTATLQVTPASTGLGAITDAHIDIYIPFASHPLAVSLA